MESWLYKHSYMSRIDLSYSSCTVSDCPNTKRIRSVTYLNGVVMITWVITFTLSHICNGWTIDFCPSQDLFCYFLSPPTFHCTTILNRSAFYQLSTPAKPTWLTALNIQSSAQIAQFFFHGHSGNRAYPTSLLLLSSPSFFYTTSFTTLLSPFVPASTAECLCTLTNLLQNWRPHNYVWIIAVMKPPSFYT